jgi:hypothetical protein
MAALKKPEIVRILVAAMLLCGERFQPAGGFRAGTSTENEYLTTIPTVRKRWRAKAIAN